MQHVGQRFRVHETVLNGHVEQSDQRKSIAGWNAGIAKRIRQLLVQNGSHFSHIVSNGGDRRPVRRLISGQSASNRVDAKSEQPVILGIKALESKNALVKKIPIESLQMADIEDDPVTFRNGAFVEKFGLDQSEQVVGALTGVRELRDHSLVAGGIGLRGWHSDLPISW